MFNKVTKPENVPKLRIRPYFRYRPQRAESRCCGCNTMRYPALPAPLHLATRRAALQSCARSVGKAAAALGDRRTLSPRGTADGRASRLLQLQRSPSGPNPAGTTGRGRAVDLANLPPHPKRLSEASRELGSTSALAALFPVPASTALSSLSHAGKMVGAAGAGLGLAWPGWAGVPGAVALISRGGTWLGSSRGGGKGFSEPAACPRCGEGEWGGEAAWAFPRRVLAAMPPGCRGVAASEQRWPRGRAGGGATS